MFKRRWCASLTAALLFLSGACAPANERPVRGAVPGSDPPTPSGVPPTLSSSEALRLRPPSTPSPLPPTVTPAKPSPGIVASPSASVTPPIVRTIAPIADGRVPAGQPVTLSAVLVGRGADLASASLSVNGTDTGAQIDKRSPRDWTIHTSQKLGNGTHMVRVLVRDASGASGGFSWHFVVGDEPAPTPTP